MILDTSAVDAMAQSAADMSNQSQQIYQRHNGSFIYCAKGNFEGLKMALKPNEQVRYIKTVHPSYWPKDKE